MKPKLKKALLLVIAMVMLVSSGAPLTANAAAKKIQLTVKKAVNKKGHKHTWKLKRSWLEANFIVTFECGCGVKLPTETQAQKDAVHQHLMYHINADDEYVNDWEYTSTGGPLKSYASYRCATCGETKTVKLN